jgi:hypothetical protein
LLIAISLLVRALFGVSSMACPISEYSLPVNRTLQDAAGDQLAGQPSMLGPLQAVANVCTSGACPTVYMSASGRLVVQGYAVSAEHAGVELPDGEMLVEIPLALLTEAARNLS